MNRVFEELRRNREEEARLEARATRLANRIAFCQLVAALLLCWLVYSCAPQTPATVNVSDLRGAAKYQAERSICSEIKRGERGSNRM